MIPQKTGIKVQKTIKGKCMSNLNFGQALEAVKQGKKIQRSGWNGKGMFLFLVKGETVKQAIGEHYGKGVSGDHLDVYDSIYMKTADNKLVPWLASQTDILAEDWAIVD